MLKSKTPIFKFETIDSEIEETVQPKPVERNEIVRMHNRVESDIRFVEKFGINDFVEFPSDTPANTIVDTLNKLLTD